MPDHTGNLAAILQRHDGGPTGFNAKVLQQAGGWASPQSAYELMHEEPAWYGKLRQILRKVPAAVARDVLADLADETPFKVAEREVEPGACDVPGALRIAGGSVTLANTISEADRDRVRTADERRGIQVEIDRLRGELDRLEAGNRAGVLVRSA